MNSLLGFSFITKNQKRRYYVITQARCTLHKHTINPTHSLESGAQKVSVSSSRVNKNNKQQKREKDCDQRRETVKNVVFKLATSKTAGHISATKIKQQKKKCTLHSTRTIKKKKQDWLIGPKFLSVRFQQHFRFPLDVTSAAYLWNLIKTFFISERSKVWVDNLLSKALFLAGVFLQACFLKSVSRALAASYQLLIPITTLISARTADQRISRL